jgi:hypothetical protein
MSLSNTITDITPIIRGLIKDMEQLTGDNLHEYKTDNEFPLSEPFVNATSIKVYINGTVTTGFTHDTDTNLVTVTASLTKDDLVRITFNFYKKHSDTEVTGYINASLAYFVQHKYKKTFKIKDDKIVSINDQNPTDDEVYFIAIIASILIDPQNIEISTPEFKMGRNREDSDQKQVSDAFAHFKRFVGNINFEKSINLGKRI